MRPSVKTGLYAVVLAGIVGGTGTGAWALTDKSVTISVDGQARSVHTRAGTVAGALKDAHLDVAGHDTVAPAASAAIHDGSKVVLLRGRELHLLVDGRGQDVWTTASTVDAALGELGYGTDKTISVSRSSRLPLTPTQITLLTPKHVTVVADSKSVALVTTEATVGGAVAAAHVTVGKDDTVSSPMAGKTVDGEIVTVKRVRYVVRTTDAKVAFSKTQREDSDRLRGTTLIVRSGKNGLTRRHFQFVYVDGTLVGKRLLDTAVVHKPIAQIVAVGTKKPVVAQPTSTERSTGTSGSDSNSGSGSNSKSTSGSSSKSTSGSSTKSTSGSSSKSTSGSSSKSTSKSSGKSTSGSSSKSTSGSSNSSASKSNSGSGSQSSGGSPRAIAAQMVSDRGWGSGQYSCLVSLWNRESGWSVHARNGSGAYGIPQALPGSKMSSAGPNWQDNAATQIRWGLGYIASRYGSPCGAWGHSQSNGWY